MNEFALPPTEPSSAPNHQHLQFKYVGRTGELFFILLKNFVLIVITFGVYFPWARAATRRYVWSQVVDQDSNALRFSGQGRELFQGMLKLAALFIVFRIVGAILGSLNSVLLSVSWLLIVALALSALVPFVMYSARRYLLSRTHYRSVRLGMRPLDRKFLWDTGVEALLVLLSLGLYYPLYHNRMHRRLCERSHYGSVPVHYDGPDREAFFLFLAALFLIPLTLGLYLPVYMAQMFNFQFNHTRVGDLQFRAQLRPADFFVTCVAGYFAQVVTLGLARPWFMTRVLQLKCAALSADGSMDFAAVLQTAQQKGAVGDVMSNFLDVDLSL